VKKNKKKDIECPVQMYDPTSIQIDEQCIEFKMKETKKGLYIKWEDIKPILKNKNGEIFALEEALRDARIKLESWRRGMYGW
jgi:hypothetical protein